jgi:hypothetical protein
MVIDFTGGPGVTMIRKVILTTTLDDYPLAGPQHIIASIYHICLDN